MKSFILFFSVLIYCSQSTAESSVPVKVIDVKTAGQQQLKLPLTGVLKTRRRSKLSSEVDAMIETVQVEAGDYVKAGQILVELDDIIAGYELKKSLAALEEAKAQLQESERLKNELGKLIKNQYLAKTSYDTAVSEVRINTAVVKRLQAEVELKRELLNEHNIQAPYNGVITEKQVEAGQWIQVGDPVLELMDHEHLRVEAMVPQVYYSRVSTNTQVLIYPDSLPDTSLSAKITQVIPLAGMSAHTFPVHINIDNTDQKLAAGMSVRIEILLSGTDKFLLLPRDAIVKKTNQSAQVWRIKQTGQTLRAYPVIVKTGEAYENGIEITSGDLKPGDKIVVRGNESLKDGQLVRMIP